MNIVDEGLPDEEIAIFLYLAVFVYAKGGKSYEAKKGVALSLILCMILSCIASIRVSSVKAETTTTDTVVATGGSGYMQGTNTSRNIATSTDGTIYVVYNLSEAEGIAKKS